MRIQLPDVNVLLALLNPSHPHYPVAKQWLDNEGQFDWATCPLTENGFLRLYTQSLQKSQTGEFEDALFLLDTLKQTYKTTHHFWDDSISFSDPTLFLPSKIAGHKQITDVYLLGLCQGNGGTLVTLDQGITTDAIINPHSDLLKILI